MLLKKVLYLSYDGMTDHLGQSQVIPYMQGLAKNGHKITIVSFEKKIQFKAHSNEIFANLNKSNIAWKPLMYTKNPPVLSTFWDIIYLLIFTIRLQKNEKFDIVHCRSYITAFAGQVLKTLFHVKFIFDMRGFWADERVEGNLWDLKKLVYKFVYRYFKYKEKQWLQVSDHIISLTENAKDYIIDTYKIDTNKITVIPCCVDTELFNPQNIDQKKIILIKKNFKIDPNQLVLGYLGSVGTWYMLPQMLLFFKLLQKKHPQAIFVFYTSEVSTFILNEAKKLELLPQSIRIKNITRNQVPNYISILDIALCFVKPSFSKKASSPTKVGELMAMGKPVICNKGVGDLDSILNTYQSGYLIDNLCVENIATAIDNLENTLNINKEKIRNAAIDFFSLANGTAKYSDVYAG